MPEHKSAPLALPLLNRGMRRAAEEARLWLGATIPNPPVGAVALDEKGEILAAAAHRRAGTAHAEAALLTLCAERDLIGLIHTLCVTLEPCNHHGRTPPCSEAIIAAGIKHVAIGAHDPNPDVKGGGMQRLRDEGIHVTENVEDARCEQLIHVFAFHARTGRPFVTVKRAFDANGSMVPPVGQKTFTSPDSLRLAHRLRKKADAIVTGSGTILADLPLFTVRHVNDFPDKRRVLAILDGRGRVPPAYLDAAKGRGLDAEVFSDLDSALLTLNERGIRDILVESGPILSGFVLDSGLWAMRVDIHAGAPERLEIELNPSAKMALHLDAGGIDSILPT
jgi:diaminohydroxyphosphoribosylaminopyrimidine deaminase/5-amino-6-(5-phosphoribosylamino)uracil reductase